MASRRQLRTVQIPVGQVTATRVVGFDMVAVMAMADARGVSRALVGDLFPKIEGAAVDAMNRHMIEH